MPAREKNGEQAIGRSRGGLTTKIHALVDALGNPIDVMLTPGQTHDLSCAEPLLDTVEPGALLGDKAFDAAPFIGVLIERDITPVIPPKANRKAPRSCECGDTGAVDCTGGSECGGTGVPGEARFACATAAKGLGDAQARHFQSSQLADQISTAQV